MIVVDAHQDIAYNALCFGRDYRRPAYETRRREAGGPVTAANGLAVNGLPDALLGRVGVVFATLFVEPHDRNTPSPWARLAYSTPAEAYQRALEQWDYYQRLADEDDRIRLLQTTADLDAVLASWAEGKEIADHQQGLALLMENADPILEPKQFEEWYGRGVRIVGPAWRATRYSGGTGQPGPLTKLGLELLDVLASFKVILDVSHMAEQACLQALDRYQGAIIASHSNPRRFRDSDRHLSEATIRRLAERGGVVGIVPYNAFLRSDWRSGDRKTDVPLSVVLDAIDYVCQLTGSAAHVAIGSDFDGGFGAESIPDGLDTVADLGSLGPALRLRGYAPADVEAILSGNMLRQLRQALAG
jgi:membrane dipeptidase